MCQIIYKLPGKPFDFENILNCISRAIQYNRDGWGLIHNKIGENSKTKEIYMHHGLSPNLEYISQIIKKLNIQDCDEIAIHLRQATHGRINLLNCHPFLIGTEQTEWLAYTTTQYPAMMHNGFMPEYKSTDIKSDSCQIAEKISKDIWKNGQLTQFINDEDFRDKILTNNNLVLSCNKYLFILPKIFAGIKSIMLGQWNTYGDIMTSSIMGGLYINGKIDNGQSKKNGLYADTPRVCSPVIVEGFKKKKPQKPLMAEGIFSPDVDENELKELIKTMPVNQVNVGDVFIDSSSVISFWYGLVIIKEIYSTGNYSVASPCSSYGTIKDDEDMQNYKKVNLENYDEVYSAINNNKKEFDILKEKVMNLIDCKNFKNKLKVHGVGKIPMTTVWYALLMLNNKLTHQDSIYVGGYR